jgi:tetratricopeptide (TPR) repeat protein
MNIPFDVSYHFNENLHDVPNSPVQMQQAIKFLQSQFENYCHDRYQKIHLAGLIGCYGRMLRDFSTAEQALITALKLCDREAYPKGNCLKDKRLKIANSIRLAHLYQWQQQYQLSEALFDEILTQCQSHSELKSYLNFVYQHLGKCKFDQAKYEAAQYYFNKALELRQQKGDRSLIDSTRLALNVVNKRILT